LSRDELQAHPETARLQQAVLAQMQHLSVLKIKVYNLEGLVVFSTDARQIGDNSSTNAGFLAARAGRVASELSHRDTFSAFEGTVVDRDLLSSYIPVRTGGEAAPVEGVFELYTDVTPFLQKVERDQTNMVIAVVGVLAFLYVVLFFIVRHADGVIRRQHAERIRAEETLQQIQVELEQRVNRRTAQLQASADVGRAVTSILDPDQLLREVVNLISERFGFYYAAVLILDERGQYAVLREATGEAGRLLKERGHRLEVGGQSMVGYVTAWRKPRIALDVGEEAVRFANPLLPDTRSELALPLVVGDQVLGALDVQSTQEAAFDGSSIAVLQSLADQVAVALANAQSFGSVQSALQAATRLYELNRALFTSTSPREAYAAIVREQTILPDLDRLSLFQIVTRDTDGEPIEYLLSAEWDAADGVQIEPGARFALGQLPLVGLVDREAVVVVRNADEPHVTAPTRRVLDQAGWKAAILVPLVIRGQYEGFVAGVARQAQDFSSNDLRYLQSTTEQLAVVLSSLRANEETRAALERVALLNQRLSGEAWQHYLATRHDLTIESGQLTADHPDANRLSAPIVVRGQTLGVIDLEAIDPARQWSDEEWDLLNTVSGEVALAIENARLIEQTQLRVARETQLNAIIERIRRAVNVEAILRVATEELSRVLDTSHANARLGTPATLAGHGNGGNVGRRT
jgi:GAF domain-containing protein